MQVLIISYKIDKEMINNSKTYVKVTRYII